jgi:hypothetical protein
MEQFLLGAGSDARARATNSECAMQVTMSKPITSVDEKVAK